MLGEIEVDRFDLPGSHQPKICNLTNYGDVATAEVITKSIEPPSPKDVGGHDTPPHIISFRATDE